MYQEVGYRRQFFEEHAAQAGFDPLVPSNWFTISKKHLLAKKVFFFLCNKIIFFILTTRQGVLKVLMYHKNSITQAVADLFPELGLVKSKIKAL